MESQSATPRFVSSVPGMVNGFEGRHEANPVKTHPATIAENFMLLFAEAWILTGWIGLDGTEKENSRSTENEDDNRLAA